MSYTVLSDVQGASAGLSSTPHFETRDEAVACVKRRRDLGYNCSVHESTAAVDARWEADESGGPGRLVWMVAAHVAGRGAAAG